VPERFSEILVPEGPPSKGRGEEREGDTKGKDDNGLEGKKEGEGEGK